MSEQRPVSPAAGRIVHDAEYYILQEQHGEKWSAEDKRLDAKLAELRTKHGAPPNIVHIMWDDMAFGDAGFPAINKVRGFDTPNCNRMAAEGILFTRMYTEPSCTPSRAAVMTGRHPVRNGMYEVAFPIENQGLAGDEVTIAEVLSGAGYATAFYGKWHLGDLEESYAHNQGFDEALFTPYNQVVSSWNAQSEAAGAVLGLVEEVRPEGPYAIDQRFRPKGYVMVLEGKKGEKAREWGPPTAETYDKIDPECERRTLEFIRTNAKAKKPFYVAYWPNMLSFLPTPKKKTPNGSLLAEGFTKVDAFIGKVMDELKKLGIAENTLVVAMADNGPMIHGGNINLGTNETIFRGGKGDYWEGGIRVAAFAWWPRVIQPGQIAGDMIHETDLYTTFARLAGATEYIPTDRIIDGVDQTALLLNGDTHGRRDYNFVYTGPNLAATIKQQMKRVWLSEQSGLPGVAFYNLYLDTREIRPQMVPMLWSSSQFNKMRARHELWKERYPDKPAAKGVPFTGIEKRRPETEALEHPPVDLSKLPFDPLEYLEFEPAWVGDKPEF